MYFAGEPLNDKDRLLRNPPKEEQKKYIVAFLGVEGRRTGQFNLTLRKGGKN